MLNKNNINSINNRTLDYSVTDNELQQITSLNCGSFDSNEKIKNMKGLEKLTNLQSLSINYPDIIMSG